MHPYLLTALAMLAFAANSVLCRLALVSESGEVSIDAASFTNLRLLSGAVTLAVIILWQTKTLKPAKITLLPVIMLFTYAICFSFSYINIATGTGALILFGMVQLTMIMYGLVKGERPTMISWLGILLAITGLVYLLLPGVSAPPPGSALLMAIAGVAWGVYSLAGRGVRQPIITTGWNFIGTIPLVILVFVMTQNDIHVTQRGVILAILSGAIASGVGYSIWYTALPHLTAMRAATVQLTVPIIAAVGGIILVAEPITNRLILASVAVLGGVYLTIRKIKGDGGNNS